MITGRELVEKMYSENEEIQEEKLYSTGDDELDDLLERAFCDGYEYAQKEFGRTGLTKEQAKEWLKNTGNIKTKSKFQDKFLGNLIKPEDGELVPVKKLRERLDSPNIKTKNDLIDWGINVKAGHSSGIAGVRSTHLEKGGSKSLKSNKYYDHGKSSNISKNKEIMKFVRDVIKKNSK
jgi:hypothetical protein